MSGWIKVEKDLATDPRVLRMASRLRNADVTLGSRSRIVIVGALVTLWWYADTHVREDDTLPIGPDQVDELVGIIGFCDLMPPEWLEVINADCIKLVNYLRHNGTTAKSRALAQRRQERSRKRHADSNADVTPMSRSHNANSVTRPKTKIRDKTDTSTLDLRSSETDNLTHSSDSERQSESVGWEEIRQQYPKRGGSQRWDDAMRHYRQRLAEGEQHERILQGVLAYGRYAQATGIEGTEKLQQAATFLGKNRGYLECWDLPVQMSAVERAREKLKGNGNGVGHGHGTIIEGAVQSEPAVEPSVGLLR